MDHIEFWFKMDSLNHHFTLKHKFAIVYE